MVDMPKEAKVLFGVSPRGSGTDLLIGISRASWEYMKDGHTHTIDLTKLGLPVRVIIWGGPTQAALRATVEAHNARLGLPPIDDQTERNFGIEDSPTTE